MDIEALYITGVNTEVFTFDSSSQKQLWEAELVAIKTASNTAHDKRRAQGLTSVVSRDFANWRTQVLSFVEKYTEHRTPQDIKWALNSTERALGFDITQWTVPADQTMFEQDFNG